MSSPTNSAQKSPSGSQSKATLSGATLSGGQPTFESFGSRASSVKTLSVSSKPPSPPLVADSTSALFNAATGNSASNSVNTSSSNIASDLQKISASASVSAEPRSTNSIASHKSKNSTSTRRSSGSKSFLSTVEEAMLRSEEPLEVNETQEITVIGNQGVWINREEVQNWRGSVAIEKYQINEDDQPEVITKKSKQAIEYVQELAIRYLRPPTPPAPGEIVITQEANFSVGPAPPLIIRQQPPRPETPEPLVIREAPPEPPAPIGIKKITISGKQLPPPPRKVIIERLAPLPSKPQPVLIERWLPYSQVKRRVIFNKSNEKDPVIVKPRNIIVQWEAPQVQIKKEYKYLGVITANPVEYVQTYGPTLKQAADLPSFVLDIKTPENLTLAADQKFNRVHELEGDVHALKLIDLDAEGLGEYSEYIKNISSRSNSISASASVVGAVRSRTSSVARVSNASSASSAQQGASASTSAAVRGSFASSAFTAKSNNSVSPRASSKPPSPNSAPRTTSNTSTAVKSQSQASNSSVGVNSGHNDDSRATSIVSSAQQPARSSFGTSVPVNVRTSSSAVTSSAIKSIPDFIAAIPAQSRTASVAKSGVSIANSMPVNQRASSIAQSTATIKTHSTSSGIPPISPTRKSSISSLVEQIFHTVNRNQSGGISIEDAEKALLRLNSRLGRRYGEDDVIAFFSALDKNQDGTLDFNEFKSAFENIVI